MSDNFINTSHNHQIPRLVQNQPVSNYFNYEKCSISTSGYLDEAKSTRNVRILSLNPHGCDLFNWSKMHVLKKAVQKSQLDAILMSEVNTK